MYDREALGGEGSGVGPLDACRGGLEVACEGELESGIAQRSKRGAWRARSQVKPGPFPCECLESITVGITARLS